MDNIGLPTSGINVSYNNGGTVGPFDAEILISLNRENHHPTAGYIRKLRHELNADFPGVSFFFQPADIVSQVLNFGLPSPIDIQVVGPDQAGIPTSPAKSPISSGAFPARWTCMCSRCSICRACK